MDIDRCMMVESKDLSTGQDEEEWLVGAMFAPCNWEVRRYRKSISETPCTTNSGFLYSSLP